MSEEMNAANEALAENPESSRELLEELVRFQKKQLMTDRIRTVIVILLLAAAIAFVGFLYMQSKEVSTVIKTIEQDLEKLDVEAFNETAKALTKVANQLSKIDIDELNQTVKSLDEAAKTLSNVDMEALNKLVASLSDVAENLETAVNNLKSLFSFGRR